MTQKDFVPGQEHTRQERDDADSPGLTDEELATARPFSEVFPGPVEIVGSSRGRPKLHDAKEAVTLRLSPTAMRKFKALGADWRKRMSDILEKADL